MVVVRFSEAAAAGAARSLFLCRHKNSRGANALNGIATGDGNYALDGTYSASNKAAGPRPVSAPARPPAGILR
jgi:hypothetical protein